MRLTPFHPRLHQPSPLPHPLFSFSTPPSHVLILHSPIPCSHSPLPHPLFSLSTPPSLVLILHFPIPCSHSPLPHPLFSFPLSSSFHSTLHSKRTRPLLRPFPFQYFLTRFLVRLVFACLFFSLSQFFFTQLFSQTRIFSICLSVIAMVSMPYR